jgi:hypothetical protein
MCFPSAPKPPKTTDPVADPELARQRKEAELDAASLKAENKQQRTEQALALLAGKVGRKSLFSGGQGGAGFGTIARRSLLTAGGTPPGSTSSTYQPGNHYDFHDIPLVQDPGGTTQPGTGRPGRRPNGGARRMGSIISRALGGQG